MPTGSSNQPGRLGDNHTLNPNFRQRSRHPYSVLLPVGFAVPLLLPVARCALAAPFHPCLTAYPVARTTAIGGLFSVALSLGLPPPDVIRHRGYAEPGLSSRASLHPRPPGPLAAPQISWLHPHGNRRFTINLYGLVMRRTWNSAQHPSNRVLACQPKPRRWRIPAWPLGILTGVAIGGATIAALTGVSVEEKAAKLAQSAASIPIPDPAGRKRVPRVGDNWGRCSYAEAAGSAPIFAHEPGYRPALDADRDGVACEPLTAPKRRQATTFR